MAASAWRLATAFTTVLFAIARVLGLSDAQCSIKYENQPLRYGIEAPLTCPSAIASDRSPVKWWRSVEPCRGFSEYSSTGCTSSLCSIRTNNSYFYYCCTASTVSDVLTARDEERGCFRIQVCTDASNNTRGSTIAFFNEPVQIFIEMVSEPPPEQNTSIFLTHGIDSQRLNTTVDYAVRVDGDAKLVWQFVVNLPDLASMPREGVLRFTANFRHVNSACPSVDSVMYVIPVYRRNGTSTPAVSTSSVTTEPGTIGLSTSSSTGIVGALIGVCVVCVLLAILSIGLIFCLVYCFWCRKHRKSSYVSNDINPYGMSPGTTPMTETPRYSSQMSATSTTSTQPLLPHGQYDPNHPLSIALTQNGTHVNGHEPNTPTPTAQMRLLPETPDTGPPNLTVGSSNHTMATINEEGAEPITTNEASLYACVNDDVRLQGQQTDSIPANV